MLRFFVNLHVIKIVTIMGEQIQIDFELSDTERKILSLLRRGRENAISERVLSELTGIPGVEVRAIIRHLIMEHNVLIASSVSKPAGFYIAETEDEIKEATRSLRHRGIKILMRAAKLQRISLEEIFNQTKLEFNGELKNAF
jgi:hypothetical protein